MYGLTTIRGLNKSRGHRYGLTVALAALIFLSLTPVQAQDKAIRILYKANVDTAAQAQPQDASANTYGGSTVIQDGSIGLVPGQRVSISVPSFYFAADGSVRLFKSLVLKVYDREGNAVTERESGLIYSGESGGINELGYIFTLGYVDLPVPGEPRTGRKEVWIEVQSISFSATETREDFSANILPPTFELIDDANGRTVMFGLLLPAILKVTEKTSTPAQEKTFFNAFEGFRGGVSVGAAAGQAILIQFLSADAAGSSLNKPSQEPTVVVGSASSAAHVKVFNAATGALLWTRELASLTAGLHTFDINRDELREVGNPLTGRIQLWIELVIGGVKVSSPTFEVIDNINGKTTVRGSMWGPMKESMETMKKAWKDASSTP